MDSLYRSNAVDSFTASSEPGKCDTARMEMINLRWRHGSQCHAAFLVEWEVRELKDEGFGPPVPSRQSMRNVAKSN